MRDAYIYILGHIEYKCQGNIFRNHAYSHLPPGRRLAAGCPFSALAISYRWGGLMGKHVWNELISLSFSNTWPLCNLNGRIKHGKHQKNFQQASLIWWMNIDNFFPLFRFGGGPGESGRGRIEVPGGFFWGFHQLLGPSWNVFLGNFCGETWMVANGQEVILVVFRFFHV